MAAWIASDLALLCADRKGRLPKNVAFFDYLVRSALLVDLTFLGRLQLHRETDWLDSTPTGYAPADMLLAHIAAHPQQPLIRAISSGPARLVDVASVSGSRRHRFAAPTVDLADVARVLDRVDRTLAAERVPSPPDAALASLAATLGTPAGRHDDLIGFSGPAAGLVGDCVDHLLAVREKFDLVRLAAHADGGAGSGS